MGSANVPPNLPGEQPGDVKEARVAPVGKTAPDRGDGGDGGGSGASTGASRHLRWYVVHTYSGHENKARISLLERVRQMGLDESFGDVLIPTESVLEMVKGQRRTTTRKFYPGYMFVQMEMSEQSYHLVKNTPKITGFLGGNTPTPVPEKDIVTMKNQVTEGAVKPKPKISFEQNENVRVIDGPFANFAGIVEEVKPEKEKVRVLVSIFGRATPVWLDFVQVEKA